MKQKMATLKLRDYTTTDSPNGNVQGKETYAKLRDYIDTHIDFDIFAISLEGIKNTDVSFPRECVVTIAAQYRGQKGFYLEGIDKTDRDLFDNWKYAAYAKKQPLVIWYDNEDYELIGPELSKSNSDLIYYVLDRKQVTTARVSKDLNLSIQNASTKLKKLMAEGYILRTEEIAESGGIEYIYTAIK